MECYIKLDDFGRMENLTHELPDGHEVLKVGFYQTFNVIIPNSIF